jgi:transposase
MSTSLLYHGFGVVGYDYVRTRYEGRNIVFTIRHKREKLRCPVCRGRTVMRRGTTRRRFKTVPLGGKVVLFDLEVQRIGCLRCGSVRQASLGFADPRFSYTHAFARYALELSKHMTIRDVARHLGVSWDVIKEMQKRDLTRRFSKPCLKDLPRIAIDEISIRKGHRYLTVVLDMISGAIIFVGDGKGADALDPFWKKVKRARTKIEAVAMDMSPAYIRAVSTHLPKATIVFDHFHVIKLFNDKLSELRRDLYHEAKDRLQKKVLKGTRWLLLKNPENLDPAKGERDRLNDALRLNQPLSCAYYLKEDLRQIWLQSNQEKAQLVLTDWIKRAEISGIRILMKFAKTLAAVQSGVLAYYDYRISSGPLEGINHKIKTMKRMAYGYRDMEFFKLKIMAIHETKYALVG